MNSESSFRFVQLSDIHIGSAYSYHFKPAWVENFKQCLKQLKNLSPQPEFIIITGDLTRDGNTHLWELRAVLEWLNELPYKIYTIPGNHDVGGRPETAKESRLTQKSLSHFLSVFRKDHFEFEYKGVQFIGLNSFLFASKTVAEEEQWLWLESLKSKCIRENRRSFWFMHTLPFWRNPFEEFETVPQFDTSDGYRLTDHASQIRLMKMLQECKADFVANGHTHSYLDRTVDGIRQITCPSTAFLTEETDTLGFLVYDVSPTNVIATMHPLEITSDIVGFGGGIVNVALRDYSLAQKTSAEIAKEIQELKAQHS